MNFTPARDNLIVTKVTREEETTSFGLVLVHDMQNKNNLTIGKVEKVGPGYVNAHGTNIKSAYSPGQLIVFKLHNQIDEIMEGGVKKFILTSAEVIATAE